MKLTTFITLLLVLTSCTSAPPAVSAPTPVSATVAPPDWTSKTVFNDGSNLVFVVAGAENADAVTLALPAMTRYLNLPTTTTTSVAAVREIKKFLTRMSSTAPAANFFQDGHGWWKIEVSKDDWDAARVKLKALVEFEVVPQTQDNDHTADDLLKQGRYPDAVTAYITAASASVAAGQAPQNARFKTALAKAADVLSKLTLTSATPALTAQLGQTFASSFDVRVTYGAQATAPVAIGIPLKFTYKTKTDGQLDTTSQTVVTDAQGVAKFSLPVPTFTTSDSVAVSIDASTWQQALATVPEDYQPQVASLQTSADRKLLLPYSVESAAKQFPLIVALADFDDKGGLRRGESTGSLITSLQNLGFQASGIQINPSLLKNPKDNVIVTAWRFQGKTTGRAVFGTVALVSATTAAPFTAEVTGTVKVVDLESNKLVYQLKANKVVTAKDRASAVVQAFRQWGAETASTFESELP